MKKISLILLLVFMSISVFAVEILDVNSPYRDGQDIAGVVFGWQVWNAGHWVPLCGQTFVTGADVTNISRISVAIWDATAYNEAAYDDNGAGARLIVWKDNTRREFIGEASVPDIAIPGWEPADRNKMVDFIFSPPIPVEPSTSYFVEITSDQLGAQYNLIVTWPSSINDGNWYYTLGPYFTAGDIISKFYSDAGGLSQLLQIQDMPVPEDGGFQLPWGGRVIAGQTFTATSDVLRRIDVAIRNQYGEGVGGVTMHLYKGGAGRAKYLATAYADETIIQDSWGYVSFVFSQDIETVPGSIYFMEFVSNDYFYQVGVTSGEADYTQGAFYRNDYDWIMDPWGAINTDWIMQTYTATGIFEFCGDVGSVYPALDLNSDCVVDEKDFQKFAAKWLDCGHPFDCD